MLKKSRWGCELSLIYIAEEVSGCAGCGKAIICMVRELNLMNIWGHTSVVARILREVSAAEALLVHSNSVAARRIAPWNFITITCIKNGAVVQPDADV